LTREITHLINAHIQSLHSKAAGPLKLEDAIRLDKGELPYPPSPQVIEAIAENDGVSQMNYFKQALRLLGRSLVPCRSPARGK
jgi:histidinol-phosphate aminotransferase